MKKYKRWYEKNEYLSAFMSLLESLNREAQSEIAVDLIIKASELIDRDYEKIIQKVGEFDPSEYRRWYDKNPNVHVAIESLRDLNEEQRESLIVEFSQRILEYKGYIESEEE